MKTHSSTKPPPQFTKKDQSQKEHLLKQGYANWSKKDFFLFIKMCELHGRENLQRISEGFMNKTLQEVKEYSTAFWKNWELIENGPKYVERIEKGESEINRMK